MRVRVVSVCYNEREMLPFYLRHYYPVAHEIIIYDDGSNDGCKDIARGCPAVELRDWKYRSGLVDDYMMDLWQQAISEAKADKIDWLILPDIDEILWAFQGLTFVLENARAYGFHVIASQGWNMTGSGLPSDDGQSQIWQLLKTGVPAPVYAKSIIINPQIDAKYEWNRGRHALDLTNGLRSTPPWVKLLHYRYLGYDYTAKRNARNYERVGADKGCAWSCSPTYKGEHSAEWAEKAKKLAVNALEVPL